MPIVQPPAAAAESPVTASPWLTVDEAAARAKLSTKCIYAAARSGRLRVAIVGGRRSKRFLAEWVDAFVEGNAMPIETTRGPLRLAR